MTIERGGTSAVNRAPRRAELIRWSACQPPGGRARALSVRNLATGCAPAMPNEPRPRGYAAWVSVRSLVYRWYGGWLRSRLKRMQLPAHVALIMDGNRRWATRMGYASASEGHRKGAEHLEEVLGWCDDLGIRHLTVWVASADNIRKRDADEVRLLMYLAETVIADHLRRNRRWAVHLTGQLDLLPGSTVRALKEAQAATQANQPGNLTIAIGYGGREEVIDAVVSLLYESRDAGMSLADVASSITEGSIARHLSTAGRPNPDLIIRTSGEQRLSDFLLWQGVESDLYFVDAYWPAFRYIDLLRALRSYGRSRVARTNPS